MFGMNVLKKDFRRMKMNSKNFKKFIAATTAALTIFTSMAAVPASDNNASLFGSSAITVSAASNKQYSTIAKEMKKFPQGKYWNHIGKGGNNPDGYTSTPCNHNNHWHGGSYDGSCGCNSFNNSIQCYGFARKICYDIYHQDPYNSGWKCDSKTSNLKAGDYIRSNGHSMFVKSVKGNTVVIGECNWGGTCKITWDRPITKSSISGAQIYHAPFAADGDIPVSTEKTPALGTVWVEGDTYIFTSAAQMYSDKTCKTKAGTIAKGGSKTILSFLTANNGKDTIGVIDSTHFVYVRKNGVLLVRAFVTTNDKTGVNLRDAATTTNSKVICVIPNGKKLQVTACSNDGKWAKTTYNGKTGWVNLGICKG